MVTLKRKSVLAVATLFALTVAGLSPSPAGAESTDFLSCTGHTAAVFDGPYTAYKFPNGELRFQACRTNPGEVTKSRVSYVKKYGAPTDVALYWQWVTPSGEPYETEGTSPEFHLSAGQTADFFQPMLNPDGTQTYPLQPSPGEAKYSCIQAFMTTLDTQDRTRTQKACIFGGM